MTGVLDGSAIASLWLFVAAFGASMLGGMLGMASGIFIVPLLTSIFGIDIHMAIAASLISVIACSCGSAAPLLKERLTNIRLAVVLETATTLGAFTGVFLIGVIPTAYLYLMFAIILVLSAWQMLVRRREMPQTNGPAARTWATLLRLHSAVPDRSSGKFTSYQVGSLPLGLSLMYGAGLVSALLGIGSGVLKIPAMDTALRLPIKVSSATSNFMIGVTGAASAGAYFMRGDINTAIAGPVALGSVLGAVAGARILAGISGDKLRIFFVIVLVLLAIAMGMSSFGFRFKI
ncbi:MULTISPECIES: sulfite exporter TauE/SafE family protein [unclassified Brucella]|uniref:sulfite exporter TauE/SafE family protein n=1 Tax=unclassified Brucella TaxID=2632610 RepID=UPI00217DB95A|nr:MULTISPECIES: sulfite exporter TauE/SafE family protein [unclassified Brucella]UWF67829.1 sulfite exporter TauE/SafE family protein [Brucella sp. 1315]UWF70949.1 sulfite exporter TauE/SafE family protein [Brucella sp. 2594]